MTDFSSSFSLLIPIFNFSATEASATLGIIFLAAKITNSTIGISRSASNVHKVPLPIKLDEICGSHVF